MWTEPGDILEREFCKAFTNMAPNRLKTSHLHEPFPEGGFTLRKGLLQSRIPGRLWTTSQGTRLEDAWEQPGEFWIQKVEVAEGTALGCSSKKSFGDVAYPKQQKVSAQVLTVKCPDYIDTKYFYGSAFNYWMWWFNPSQKLSIKLPLTHSWSLQQE